MTMTAESLISLANCHGVDLIAAARIAAKPSKQNGGVISKFINGIKTDILVSPPDNRVRGTQTRSALRPTWTLAELGQASQGVPQVCFWAACFAFAGDDSSYWKLQGALYDRAQILARDPRQRWPLEVTDHHGIKRPYLAHLSKLVLDHDRHSSLFRACPELLHIYMGMTERTWESGVASRFLELQSVWDSWLGTACGIIQKRLRND